MKKIVLVMLIVFLISACNSVSLKNNHYNQPLGKVILDHQEYTMIIGDYEWKERDFEARKISISDKYELAGEFSTLDVKKGENLKIEIEQYPYSIIINRWNEDGTSDKVELIDDEVRIPSKEGYYVYEIIAEWKQGKSTYVFDMNINGH
ncbi:hypothetical protein SAMN05518871_103220 [Psychrobacillus sp. OK028]|uniref:hypothetical protein n=1 Tax=Psychrobacillus sp. OK028 TaxID=1884359 RepID=UPI00088599EF|nr:hypothetical protein [Psychrobacillus sp. OK028]SDN07572.1 hypothetical protein SAMN05518871_103220 [Psychrobacillus sp. OK028]